MKYQKRSVMRGTWMKGSILEIGDKVNIISETKPITGRFRDENGDRKMQDVCKITVNDNEEEFLFSLNPQTVEGLIDAYGDDSRDWMNQELVVHKEKTTVAGKRVWVVYLLPDGYEVTEDSEQYLHVTAKGKQPLADTPPPAE